MDVIHKKVLASKTTVIMNSITSPTRIAAQLGTVFCPSDKEEIKATENRLGSIHASQTLLSLLKKRGPKAFDKFLTVLKNPDNLLTHLADDILDAERELRGEQGALRLPTPASPDTQSTDVNFDDPPDEKREVNPPSLDSGSTEQFSHQESDSSYCEPLSTGRLNMDVIHKKVLAIKTTVIMNSITSPTLIALQLSSVFCPSDKEEIKATEIRLGSIHASQTLLSLLEKRGPKAFDKFLTVLKNPDNRLTHLADELLEAERELRGEQGALRLPTPASPDTPSTDVNFDDPPDEKREVNLPSLDSGSTEQFSHQESDSRLKNLYQGQGQGQAFASNQSSSADMKNNVLSLDTLIKDIPYSLQLQIVKLMDPSDSNHHDWRGIASVMNLSADDVRQLENAQDYGKMKGLIDKMIQLKKTVNDLLGWLRNPNIARWDVIDEIKKFPNNIPPKLLSPETESSEYQSSVPLEINFRGPSAVLAYHKALSEGKTTVKRVPIMFIGQGQSGKTSLKRSLKGERFNPEETITIGIETDPSYCKLSQEVWKVGESGDEAANSDPAHISFEQCTAQCILTSLKEGINSKEMKNVHASNPESGIDLSNSRVGATNSDEEGIKLKEIKNAGMADEIDAGPDAPELKEVPDKIATLVENRLQLEDAEGAQGKQDLYSILWDFGGQFVYYATHPLFLTSRAIYLLVHDLSRDPAGKVSPQVKRGFYEDSEDIFCERSHMDYLDLWMSSVSSLVLEDEDLQEMLASEILPERLPPVFLVCTHADEPFQGSDPCELARKVFGTLKRRVYGKHLVDFFVVDNTKSGSKEKCPEVDRLRKEVETVANELPQMKEAIPIKWLKFEEEMKEKNQDGHKWISLDVAKNIATEKCSISSTEQFVAMLNFLHDQRILIHFDDTPQLNRMVILDPQWLIDVFKEVITIRPCQSQERKYEQLWLKLETTGILKEELLQHVWGPLFDNRETCHTLIAMMEKFCLLCRLPSSVAADSPIEYLVPSMLKFPPQEDVSKLIASAGIPPLYLKFKSSQVPSGLFSRVVLMVFQWCTKEFSSQTQPQLHQNFARFYTHPAEGCSLILKCHSSFIEVAVYKERCAARHLSDVASVMNLPSESTHDAFQVDFARAVCRQLRLILECMRIEFPWLKNMAYDLSVCCPVCCASRSVNHCCNHNVRDCKEEQCLHLLTESQLLASRGSIVCTRSVVALNCKVPVDSVGFWFGSLEGQQATDEYDENFPLPSSGDAHNDRAVVLCSGVLEALTSQTCDASEVVAQFQQILSLENLSLEQPDSDTKKKIRYLCLKAKTAKKQEVVAKLREITPAGTTGPLLPEKCDVAMIPVHLRKELTIHLSGGDEWMSLAEKLGLTPAEIRFLDKRVLNPCDAALEYARKQRLIQNVGDLYDRLVDCELPRLADLL